LTKPAVVEREREQRAAEEDGAVETGAIHVRQERAGLNLAADVEVAVG
jgi:hypothetical protein